MGEMRTPALIAIFLTLFILQAAAQQPPVADPKPIFERAQLALRNKDYPAAERGFQEVLRLDPRSAAAYTNLGVVYMRMEKYDSAIRALLEAKKLKPNLPGIDLNLGLAYYSKEEFPKPLRPSRVSSKPNLTITRPAISWGRIIF